MGDVESTAVGFEESSNNTSDSSLSDHLVRKGTVIERKIISKSPSDETEKGASESGVGQSKEFRNLIEGSYKPGDSEAEEDALEDLEPSMMPRTIPFRSASFSQVDVTSEGKYVRNPRSPITLKPSAFCLLPNTLPRANSKHPGQVLFQVGDPDYVDPATIAPNFIPGHSSSVQKQNIIGDELLTDKLNPSKEDAQQIITAPHISGYIDANGCDNELRKRDAVHSDCPNSHEAISDTGTSLEQCSSIMAQLDKLSLEPNAVEVQQLVKDEPVQDISKMESGNFADNNEVIANLDSEKENRTTTCEVKPSSSTVETETGEGLPRIVREESVPLKSSSSEESADPPLFSSEKAKIAFKLGLHAKLPLLDLDGGGSSVSGSGGEDDDKSTPQTNNLIRQSSGQSDGSEGQLSDPCASPQSVAGTHSTTLTKPRSIFRSSGGVSLHSPPPISSSGYRYNYRSPASPPAEFPSRTNSISSSSYSATTPRRYYKRPLRGPYGEMLEERMNKVWSGRKSLTRELENLDFCRESKSSSPPPNECLPLLGTSPKLGNPLLMSSMDDINLNSKQNKHQNPRCRKISANIPASSSHYHTGESSVPPTLVFHQRTASSPSQLLYASKPEPKPQQRRNLRMSGQGEEQNEVEEGVGPKDQGERATDLITGDMNISTISILQSQDGSPRGHVLAELVETEKSYVESLRILVKKYMEPLKSSDFIDTGLIDEIFFQIPIILWHHERILEALQRRVIDETQSVGDVLLDAFRQTSLLECYALFVNNWKNAKGSLKMAVASKPPLARFLEANARQHKGKLSIDSLLIMPIQRIPRYELLVKELLKHTEPTHEDHSRLMLVLEKIKKFAVHIDCASVDPNDNRDIEIEGWSAGLGHLIRQDVVTIVTPANVRKERALFLFADSIVVASIKRKTTMRKTSSNQYQPLGPNLEGCKFKLLMKVGLTEVHVVSEESEGCIKGVCPEELDDLKTIHKMMELACLLKCPHLGLDDILRELASSLRHHCDNDVDAVDLEIKTSDASGENPEMLKLLFGSADRKNSWMDAFQDTVGKFIRYGFGRLPQMTFVHALPIRKTRAGLQLSCAAPVWLLGNGQRVDVWVANSDGYVGQICILTLHPEPAITSCNGVCNSRITCIISVPPGHHPHETPPVVHGYESEDDGHRARAGHKPSPEHWNVWLGTEDGALHVYDCSNSSVRKSKHKVQHKAALNCMAYYEDRVFIALANGDVAMYTRNPHGKGWLVNDPIWLTMGQTMNPVTRMTCIASSLWCVSGPQIRLYGNDGFGMLELLQTLHVGGENTGGVSTLTANEENTVWVALQSSSVIKCYSNSTFDILCHLDVSPEVTKILSGCDDIIRQHKSACLRVTALLVAPDKTLWIGTSAGVILTYTTNGPTRKLTPLCQGHSGSVRFLTCCTSRDSSVVISGGDGYEEFRPGLNSNPSSATFTTSSSLDTGDLSGREDSTNHLLIWRLLPKLANS